MAVLKEKGAVWLKLLRPEKVVFRKRFFARDDGHRGRGLFRNSS